MNNHYDSILRQLRGELARIDHAIATLSALQDGEPLPAKPRSTRGRKPGMSAAERHEVSERMKRYWAGRRQAKASTR